MLDIAVSEALILIGRELALLPRPPRPGFGCDPVRSSSFPQCTIRSAFSGGRGAPSCALRARSTMPSSPIPVRPLLNDEGRPVYETRALASPRVYQYTVFNAGQCDGRPTRLPRVGSHKWDGHEAAVRVLRHSGAVIEHSGLNRAYYDLRRHRIVLPFNEQFSIAPSHFQMVLNEFGHWTGHPVRLNRSTLTNGRRISYSVRLTPTLLQNALPAGYV